MSTEPFNLRALEGFRDEPEPITNPDFPKLVFSPIAPNDFSLTQTHKTSTPQALLDAEGNLLPPKTIGDHFRDFGGGVKIAAGGAKDLFVDLASNSRLGQLIQQPILEKAAYKNAASTLEMVNESLKNLDKVAPEIGAV